MVGPRRVDPLQYLLRAGSRYHAANVTLQLLDHGDDGDREIVQITLAKPEGANNMYRPIPIRCLIDQI
jgi:hypothetical protein